MKRIGILLLIAFLWSCGGSGEDTPTPFTNGPLDKLAQTYHIKDTVGLTDVIVSEKDDYHYLVGKKNGKFWLAQYDINTKEELYSFVDKEGKFKFTETVDLGFEETVEYKVDLSPLTVCSSDKLLTINFDLTPPNEAKKCVYYIIDNNQIVKSFILYENYNNSRVWYNQSIIFYTKDMTADSRFNLFHVHLLKKNEDGDYEFYKIDYYSPLDIISGVEEFHAAIPIGMLEYICNDEKGTISRKSISPVSVIWSKQVKTYDQAAKFNFTLLNQTDKELKYKANVILFDGSKDSFEFIININTGNVKYL